MTTASDLLCCTEKLTSNCLLHDELWKKKLTIRHARLTCRPTGKLMVWSDIVQHTLPKTKI